MALNKEAPGFDIDDEVLLMDSSIDSDLMSEEDDSPPTARTKSKKAAATKQHKYIDYTRALDATQLYLNEIGFSPLLSPAEEVHFARLSQSGDPAGRNAQLWRGRHQLRFNCARRRPSLQNQCLSADHPLPPRNIGGGSGILFCGRWAAHQKLAARL